MPDKPVFIVGVGRSGSTALFNFIKMSPLVYYLTVLANKYPRNLSRNRLFFHALKMPLVKAYLEKKNTASEAYDFWETYIKGFRRPCRDLLAEDLTLDSKNQIINALNQINSTRRSRLIVKITGWNRMRFLNEIFPNAKYIHLVRDGRAVVNSMIKVGWWNGWGGPAQWRWGELTNEEHKMWDSYKKSFLALAGIEWNILNRAFQEARDSIAPENLMEIRYEDVCMNPVESMKKIFQFSELNWPKEFESKASAFFRSQNEKWKNNFTEPQTKMLNDVMSQFLEHYHYL